MAKFTIGGVEVDESEVFENELLNIEYCFIAFNKMLDDLLNNWRVRETDPAAAIAQAEKSISTTRRIIERLKDPASSGPRKLKKKNAPQRGSGASSNREAIPERLTLPRAY